MRKNIIVLAAMALLSGPAAESGAGC